MWVVIESGCLGSGYEVDTYLYRYLLSGFVLAALNPWGYSASQSSGFVDEAVCRTIEDLGFICRLKQEFSPTPPPSRSSDRS